MRVFGRTSAVAAAAMLLAGVLMTGCTSAAPDASPAPSASRSTTGTPAAPSSADTASTEEGPTTAAELPVSSAPIGDAIELTTGMTVSLASVRSGNVTADTPGEMAGPAVFVEVAITNVSSETQSVDSAVVTLVAADGEYGIPTIGGGFVPFGGTIAAGESATALYVFMLDPAGDREVTVTVNYSAGEPLAEFTGRTS